MSSLRLALKQSLAETGHLAAQQKEKERRQQEEEDRRRKDKRRRQRSQQQRPGADSRNRKQRRRRDSLQSHLEKGGGNTTIHLAAHVGLGGSRRSVSSSTLSSSGESDSESTSSSSDSRSSDDGSSSDSSDSESNVESSSSDEDDRSTSSSSDDGMEMEGVFDSEVSSDDEDDTSSKKQRKQEKKNAKKRTNAANTIQNHWKQKTSRDGRGKSRRSSENHNRNSSSSLPTGRSRKKQTEGAEQASVSSSLSQNQRNSQMASNKQKKTANNKKSASSSAKSQTVPPPGPEIISWMRKMSTGKQRRSIAAGLRVKVQFAEKSSRKGRDGKPIKRLRWYGGLVTDVSTGGRRIRIKYDDGTSEVADFPDRDIVVDCVSNGRHRAPADAFNPPPPSQIETNPPSSERPTCGEDHVLEGKQAKKNCSSKNTSWSSSPEKEDAPTLAAKRKEECSSSDGNEMLEETPTSAQHTPLSAMSSAIIESPFSPNRDKDLCPDSSSSSNASERCVAERDESSQTQTELPGENSEDKELSRVNESKMDPYSAKLNRCPSLEGERTKSSLGSERNSSSHSDHIDSNSPPSDGIKPFKSLIPGSSLTIRLIPPKIKKVKSVGSALSDEARSLDEGHAYRDVADTVLHGSGSPDSTCGQGNQERSPAGGECSQSGKCVLEVGAIAHTIKVESNGELSEESTPSNGGISRPRKRPFASSKSNEEPSTKKVTPEWGEEKKADEIFYRGTSSAPRLNAREETEPNIDDFPVGEVDTASSPKQRLDLPNGGTAVSPRSTEEKTVSKMTVIESDAASFPLSKKTKEARDRPRNSGVPSSVVLSVSKKRKRDRDGREKSLSPVPDRRSSGSRSPKRVGSPTQLSSHSEGSNRTSHLAKPVVIVGGVVPHPDSGDDNTGKVSIPFAGSENSAFEMKGKVSPLKVMKSAKTEIVSDAGGSEGALPTANSVKEEVSKRSRITIVPSARSGRRAAQKAAERIKAKQEIVIEDEHPKKRKKQKLELKLFPNTSGSADDEDEDTAEEDEEEEHWVQCDRCMKWRLLPSSVQMDGLPDRWYCELNTYDLIRNTCDAPEQTSEEIADEKEEEQVGPSSSVIPAESPQKPEHESNNFNELEDAEHMDSDEGLSAEEHSISSRERQTSRSPTSEEDQSTTDSGNNAPEESPTDVKLPKQGISSACIKPGPPSSSSTDSADESQEGASFQNGKSSSMEIVTGRKVTPTYVNDSTSSLPLEEEGSDFPGEAVSSPKPRVTCRNRSRPRPKDPEKGGRTVKTGKKSSKSVERQEWVQCEKCEKWRRLPPRISAEDLPDVWYCSMNTWDIRSASCDVEEDQADSNICDYTILGRGEGATAKSVSSGKLSYRNLIFGSGRRQNRPVSERTRAAESLFGNKLDSSTEGNGYPTVMYANSSAFMCKGANRASSDDAARISFLDIMNHSKLWEELYGGARALYSLQNSGSCLKNGQYEKTNLSTKKMRRSMKDLVYHSLGTKTMSGHEVLLEAQCRSWGDVGLHWSELRSHCTLEVITLALGDLVNEGMVEIVQDSRKGGGGDDDLVCYRRVMKNGEDMTSNRVCKEPKRSRCIKIAKPWKSGRSDVAQRWCI